MMITGSRLARTRRARRRTTRGARRGGSGRWIGVMITGSRLTRLRVRTRCRRTAAAPTAGLGCIMGTLTRSRLRLRLTGRLRRIMGTLTGPRLRLGLTRGLRLVVRPFTGTGHIDLDLDLVPVRRVVRLGLRRTASRADAPLRGLRQRLVGSFDFELREELFVIGLVRILVVGISIGFVVVGLVVIGTDGVVTVIVARTLVVGRRIDRRRAGLIRTISNSISSSIGSSIGSSINGSIAAITVVVPARVIGDFGIVRPHTLVSWSDIAHWWLVGSCRRRWLLRGSAVRRRVGRS